MLFGEIVEPRTRALLLEEGLEELPEYTEPVFEWKGDPQPPKDIETLIFAESPKVIQICTKISKHKPVAKLSDESLSIYKFQNKYLVAFTGNSKNLLVGEIVELLSSWIQKAKSVHCITSSLIITFQPHECLDRTPDDTVPVTFSRCLTNLNEVPFNFCKRLESPNLIQGLGANVLSYCIHNNVKASLWVIFTDNMPADSMNTAEILRLFNNLGLEGKVDFKVDSLSSNLYM